MVGGVLNLLSLDFFELGNSTAQLFWRLLLSQLFYLCLQGSQLLLQRLWNKTRLRQELKLGQYNMNSRRSSIWNMEIQYFIDTEKPTPRLSSLWTSCCLVLPVASPPLILASCLSLGSYKAKWKKGSPHRTVSSQTESVAIYLFNDIHYKRTFNSSKWKSDVKRLPIAGVSRHWPGMPGGISSDMLTKE